MSEGKYMTNYGENLFEGAAAYYAQYRPVYPAHLIRFLVEKFADNGQQKLLDIGCGTGEISFRLFDWFDEVIGIDTDKEMLCEAMRKKELLRVSNVHFFNGDLAQFLAHQSIDKLQLVTMAKSFHWMDREALLHTLYPLIQSGGGVALIDQYIPNKEITPWEQAFKQVVKKWYGAERRAGNTTYTHPVKSHATVIEESAFTLQQYSLAPYTYTWTIDAILGNHYSTSYGLKQFLGSEARIQAFEQDVRETLLQLNPAGVFEEILPVSVKLAMK